ncbi:hypothetical protein HTZ84_14300 [Haloterrigena sp. SYSU A558-1]|uniref:Beta-ketoadipyl CoA thiolase n=1 Tax=Haloterrigena gelatinilytica TaxID=2741724 RepID=A0A8J8GNE7_9EURY|nr:hypothetical protein [Haloterrigena gelatinilytica]NUB90710.1 hypothetical protein [Haloterrigena gelatinilytica]NUC73471.1 hypothetical protein [Haloterrigena gelatinilytica]
MSTELVAFGVSALALGIGVLIAGRRLYPRLDVPEDAESTLQLLTAMIAGVLLLTGLGLVLVGLFT